MSREDDIKQLCKSVLEDVELNFWDNPNGPYEYTCPFCHETEERRGDEIEPTMSTFKHSTSCAYLIAKDLMTNIE